ncbi:MAG TPA: Flp family type IVb pilin [Deltaproteobacteria bacterium]|nr:Flp family type IVb pilin [Deltaproteobacteria bacterium]
MRTALFTQNIVLLMKDERAGTHIEYALIGGFTGVLLMGGLLSLEGGLSTFYNGLAGLLDSVL